MASSTATKPAKPAKPSEALDPIVQLPAETYRSPSKEENIVASLVGLAIVGVVGTLSYFGWKNEQQRQAELDVKHAKLMAERDEKRKAREEWFERQRLEGKIVVETADGHYMAIPAEAYAKSESRKKAL